MLCTEADASLVCRAARVLRAGGVVALPTDTIYGVAAWVPRAAAVHRLYELKGRHELKPLAICVPHVHHIPTYAAHMIIQMS